MRLRLKPFLVVLGSAATVAAGAGVLRAWAIACTNPAAYGLYASSYADTMLNPGKAEDVDFFAQTGGVPNIMILFDNSNSMNRLAPNGPHSYGTLPPAGTVGCGPAASEGGLSDAVGTMVATINARRFATPCGTSVSNINLGVPSGTPGASLGNRYNPGAFPDYADEASTCPRWVNPNPVTGADGWDPEWYCGSGPDADSAILGCNSKPSFFDRNIVVHESERRAASAAYDNVTMRGDGWTYAGVFPHLDNGNRPASIEETCDAMVANGIMPATQGALNTTEICRQCLTTRGWFFDGRIDTNVVLADSPTPQSMPQLWYTGNYLNFFPPKFLVARKILKDTIMGFSKVRAAIASFTTGGATVSQPFNPDCAHPDSSFDSNRTTYMTTLDALPIDGEKPMSKALLDIGWYYHSAGLDWFQGSWPTHTVPATNGAAPGDNSGSYSVCYSCQVSSVVLVTDGLPTQAAEDCSSGDPLPVGPSSLAGATSGVYAGDLSTGLIRSCSSPAATDGVDPSDCPECYAFSGAEDYKNNLARVAWYLHNYDLRRNEENTRECGARTNGGRQTLDFYAIGFGSATAGTGADTLLGNAAKVGGGLYVPANSVDEVRQSLSRILEVINTRATSFSVASISPVQSQAGHSVIIPRFEPSKESFWRGHLSRFELFSEFVNGCKPTGNPADGDLDCDGTCGGVFLQDKLGRFIQEDGTGAVKVNVPNVPSCSESECTPCGVASGGDAEPWWDAGEALAETGWRARRVYSVVDDSGPSGAPDGKIDTHDTTFRLVADDATADRLIPYLNVLGTDVCTYIGNQVWNAGDAATGASILTDATRRECAKELIRYALGADSFNSKNLSAPDYPPVVGSFVNRDALQDRDWKLGDIFHSSPIVVDAPAPADGVLCTRGLSRQCIPSLWNTPVQHDAPAGTGTAYDGYSKSTLYQHRRKMVLAGANDGMLHAFDGGKWLPNEDDTVLTPPPDGIDESQPPFNGYYQRERRPADTHGPGDELWAFIPPDQLPKLHLLASQTHNLFVDGTPMVRDVWVDGTTNGLDSVSSLPDDKKQAREYHTVAVIPERRGGVHHFALDVTDAFRHHDEAGFAPPKFLWIYPQPSSEKVLYAGETYSDFIPLSPPVGPVRVRADAVSGAAIAGVTPTTATGVPYHERWVAFLSGGFDPQYVRGRGVHMVDVWTGEEVFDFSHPPAGSSVAIDDPRWRLRYPVAATVAMVMWGTEAKNSASFRNDGYFDTATFGDTGGQLWVLRFNAPAILDSTTKLATNWLGARIFQMGGVGGARFCSNEPFFYITSNVALTADGTYRVMAGTGDRYNLLDQRGGVCSPDNIRACLQRGCRVSIDPNYNRIAQGDKGDRRSGIYEEACNAPSFGESFGTYGTCNTEAAARVVVDGCPAYTDNQVATVSTKDMQLTCAQSGNGYGCSYRGGTTPTTGSPLSLAEGSYSITQINKFFSMRVFDMAGNRAIFTTPAQAAAYDQARLTDTSLVQIDGAAATPATLSSVTDNGYVLNFNHAPTVTIDDVAYTVTRQDERVSSPSAIGANCVVFNTTQTTTAAVSTSGSCFASNCTQLNRRIHYLYGADATTGKPCLTDSDGDLVRSIAKVALVPPAAPQFTLFVSEKGQVQAGLTRVLPEKGAGNVPLGGAIDAATILETIDIPRDVHDCRHADPNGVAPTCR